MRSSTLPKATVLQQARGSTFSQTYAKIMELFPIGCFADQSTTVFQKHWDKFMEERYTKHSVYVLNTISVSESFWTADSQKLSKFTGRNNMM